MTMQELLKLIKAKQKNADAMSELWKKEGKRDRARDCLRDSMAYDDIIWLITDSNYADKMRRIFADDLKEGNEDEKI